MILMTGEKEVEKPECVQQPGSYSWPSVGNHRACWAHIQTKAEVAGTAAQGHCTGTEPSLLGRTHLLTAVPDRDGTLGYAASSALRPINPLSSAFTGTALGSQQKLQGDQKTSGDLVENILLGPHTLHLSPRLIQSASASSQIKIWTHHAIFSSQLISCILGQSYLATAR